MSDFEVVPSDGISVEELKLHSYAELQRMLSIRSPLSLIEGLDGLMAKKIIDTCMTGDAETDHVNADEILIEILRSAGMDMVSDAWCRVKKWYA